ncbi:contact-dependent growth inhibition system immunity protein [Paenibacillus sp. WLX1005]|uniref:contact-dependent growth inhibition system immunity protein n=1 Tax=Paenibacillus sp. WLX1005 TaxID=3243766 RepID=UPI0039843642
MQKKYETRDFNELTISEISRMKGLPDDEPDKRIPLSVWIHDIRNIPLKQLTDGDIAKLIRQTIFLSYIVPIAYNRINNNPLAGSLGDGEVIESFQLISVEEWKKESKALCIDTQRFFGDLLWKLNHLQLDIPYDTEGFDDVDKADLENSIQRTIENLNEALQ